MGSRLGRRPVAGVLAGACALFLTGAAGAANSTHAAAWTKTDQLVTAGDGTELATTLYEPVGAPPSGGWPAIVMFHGLGGTRESMNALAEQTFANEGYAVLTADHRGHGQSGGLFDADGPAEIQDARDLFDWLAARPEIDGAHVGAWGISLGGGVVWGALKAGVPFAAAEVYETWVDLFQSLAPRSLSKSGAVFQFLSSVPTDRTAPGLNAMRSDILGSTNTSALRAYADARSVMGAVAKIRTPVFVFQGRRDFAFGLEQGIAAYKGLAGPKRLYIGDFGHAPSTFPGPDSGVVFAEAADWFARYLKGEQNGIDERRPVELAPDPFREASNVSYAGLPPTTTVRTATAKPGRTFGSRGRLVLTFALPKRKLEVFGAPVVTVSAATKTRAKQLVAVVEAVAPGGGATIVSEGGTLLPTASKKYKVSFPLVHDTALIAKGSKLRVTLSWTTTAQSAANLLYLTGVPDGSSLTVKTARIALPTLKAPISG
jgi:predicted acyl esterase